MMPRIFTMKKPDDFHYHFRDGDYLARTVPDAAKQFHRVIAMPNLQKPVTTVAQAIAYRSRIHQHVPPGCDLVPLMTLYLTDKMSVVEIQDAKKSGVITACKLYPAGATTHSEFGVRDLNAMVLIFDQMQAEDIPLCVHGESIDPSADIFDRERLFLESLQSILKNFPKLRVVLEHISTKAAVDFVWNGPDRLAATITPHHLLFNRNHLLVGGVHPHFYCLPILKRAEDQKALITAATSGHAKFFLGTDGAPHTKAQKESACGCAGVYCGEAALPLYAEIFEQAGALNQLEKFASIHGAQFYQLPVNTNEIALIKKSWRMPSSLAFGEEQIVPIKAGEMVSWQIR